MTEKIRHIIYIALIPLLITGCVDDWDTPEWTGGADGVRISAEIIAPEGTRGIDDESKTVFETGELIHIRAEFECVFNGEEYTETHYGVVKYAGKGVWNPLSDEYALIWPNEAVRGHFTAYYMNGSTGAFTENTMQPRLLSSYGYAEIPLSAEVKNVKYGEAVKLKMKRMFAHLKLTELREGISNQLWFTVPESDEVTLNNAFRFEFDPDTREIKPSFLQVPSSAYKDSKGNGLVYIDSKIIESDPEGMGEMTANVSYFLEPGVYHKFDILYPRSHDTYSTYLSYGRHLNVVVKDITGEEDLKANGRYVFSILKSLGVIVDNAPEQGWDKTNAAVEVDVEKFLRAVNSGSSYYETDPETGEEVQILEQTVDGTRLLMNVDFKHTYYDVFGEDAFKPILNTVFNGNYHYIHNMGCPLFYQNDGTIINLGIKNADTSRHPLVSSENFASHGSVFDNSYNGIIASRNYGTVSNVRVSGVKMTVQILTSDADNITQEAHNVALLFGTNSGNIYDVALAGMLTLTVENHPSETVIPRVSIGGIVGQNLGLVSGIDNIDDEGFYSPMLTIINNCKGDNGVYKMGGIAGNHTGTLDDLFIPSLQIVATDSRGLESSLGGLVGEVPTSPSGAPSIFGCIVRGEVSAGVVNPILNLESFSYAGGIAGIFNVQGSIKNCSISVGVTGSPNTIDNVDYAEGGAFGFLRASPGYAEGEIHTVACFGSRLLGHDKVGNFAGIASAGYDWNHYKDNQITIKQMAADNVGAIR